MHALNGGVYSSRFPELEQLVKQDNLSKLRERSRYKNQQRTRLPFPTGSQPLQKPIFGCQWVSKK